MIIKPKSDSNIYTQYILKNNLKVITISNPTLKKSCAALSVNVGYIHDPPELPGLAHFVEHLLFMGTKKYPKENEYNEFLSFHNGYSNAHTTDNNTVYYFDIDSSYFKEALDRFANFFIEPLFNKNSVKNEINSVNSEYLNTINDDELREDEFLNTLMKHPHNKFGIGNKFTLNCTFIREESISFFKKYYKPESMNLIIMGKESNDDLKDFIGVFELIGRKNIIETNKGDIKDRDDIEDNIKDNIKNNKIDKDDIKDNIDENKIDKDDMEDNIIETIKDNIIENIKDKKKYNIKCIKEDDKCIKSKTINKKFCIDYQKNNKEEIRIPFKRKNQGYIYHLKPINSINKLTIAIPLPFFKKYPPNTYEFIQFIFELELKNLFINKLKIKNLIFSFYTKIERYHKFTLFKIIFELSPKGIKNYKRILNYFYGYRYIFFENLYNKCDNKEYINKGNNNECINKECINKGDDREYINEEYIHNEYINKGDNNECINKEYINKGDNKEYINNEYINKGNNNECINKEYINKGDNKEYINNEYINKGNNNECINNEHIDKNINDEYINLNHNSIKYLLKIYKRIKNNQWKYYESIEPLDYILNLIEDINFIDYKYLIYYNFMTDKINIDKEFIEYLFNYENWVVILISKNNNWENDNKDFEDNKNNDENKDNKYYENDDKNLIEKYYKFKWSRGKKLKNIFKKDMNFNKFISVFKNQKNIKKLNHDKNITENSKELLKKNKNIKENSKELLKNNKELLKKNKNIKENSKELLENNNELLENIIKVKEFKIRNHEIKIIKNKKYKKSECRILIKTDVNILDRIYFELRKESMLENYDIKMQLKKVNFEINTCLDGLEISVTGFKILKFINYFFKVKINFKFLDSILGRIKEELNSYRPSYVDCFHGFRKIMIKNYMYYDEILEIMNNLKYFRRVYGDCKILFIGNDKINSDYFNNLLKEFDKKENDLFFITKIKNKYILLEENENKIIKLKEENKEDENQNKYILLEENKNRIIKLKEENKEDENQNKYILLEENKNRIIKIKTKNKENAIGIFKFISYTSDIKNKIIKRLILQLSTELFFDELRNKQQLGYVIKNSEITIKKKYYEYFIVQSIYPIEYLKERIYEFFEFLNLKIKNLSEVEFLDLKESLINSYSEDFNNVGEFCDYYWSLICDDIFDINYRSKSIKIISDLKREDLNRFLTNEKVENLYYVNVYSEENK